MARNKRNRNRSASSHYIKNRAVALIQPPRSNDKTGGSISSPGIEASGATSADSSCHPAGNQNTTVEIAQADKKVCAVRNEVNMQGIVDTEGNPIVASHDKGRNTGKGDKEDEEENEANEAKE
eukprot:559250-Ditylum_brightwellii.AAC.1